MSKIREPDIIFKWTNCCRLCLSQESTIDLFSETGISQHFPSKIRSCLNFLIYSGDPMPRKICSACCIKLDSWCQFRKECIQTERDLKRKLEPYKRIAFVKEYFTKYMKYEKSSQDGCVSLDSMSDYDEDEDMESNSDYMQREDENSELSDEEKLSCSDNRQKNQQFRNNNCKPNNLKNDMVTNGSPGKHNTQKNESSPHGNLQKNCGQIEKETKNVDQKNMKNKEHELQSEEDLNSCVVHESGAESDDNDNFINPLSFVDISLCEPSKEVPQAEKKVICEKGLKTEVKKEVEKELKNGNDKTEVKESNHLKKCDEKSKEELFCLKCNQYFSNKELLEKHELVHNQQDIFNAIHTPQFTTFEGVDDLEEPEDGKKPNVVRCFRCGRIFNTPEELDQHEIDKHKNPTPYFCRKCDLRFSARSQLLMHVRSHMRKSSAPAPNNSDNTCSICNAKFFLPSDLQSHLRMHKYSPVEDSAPTKSCQSPDQYGDNKIDLFARFKCSICSKIFVHSGSIIRHGKNLHKGQTVYPLRLKRPIFLMKRARSLPLPPEKKKPPSDENSESLDLEMNLDQDPENSKTDLDIGTEKCPFCDKVFKPTYLPRHIKRNHRGEVLDPQMLGRDIPDDSLICRYCLKSCSNPHNRRVHESIHYPVKMQSTQCKICGQKFFNQSSYEIHIHACKSVRCGKCNKKFFRYLSLKSHTCIMTVTSEKKP